MADIQESLKRESSLAMNIECGHFGVTKTDMYHIVSNVTVTCSLRAQIKVMNYKFQGAMGHMLATEPLQVVCADLYGSLSTGKGGQPMKIISHNGPQFKSNKWKTLATVLGIDLAIHGSVPSIYQSS
ncbi:hypothetical protein PR048_009854 [Dryococelus australis]|uniref:Integrase catalytic domain-containing protein n=1 Tax=Dryococelus australis TaxID=614101 RepID=A0ABQ9I1V0_9NEOP|nr:hypothetical protein PR048_009854 [Dryococelus australis]